MLLKFHFSLWQKSVKGVSWMARPKIANNTQVLFSVVEFAEILKISIVSFNSSNFSLYDFDRCNKTYEFLHLINRLF